MINKTRFVVASNAQDAHLDFGAWLRHPEMQPHLEETSVFTDETTARDRVKKLQADVEADGMCEPGHECGRCKGWDPQVWRVSVIVTPTAR